MLEGTNIHLCVLINQRDTLTLVKETELVDSVHIRSANDLSVITPSLYYRRVITVVTCRIIGKSLPHVRIEHHKLYLYIIRLKVKTLLYSNNVRLPFLSIEFLDVDGVVQLILNAIHHVVSSDFRLWITSS